MKYVFNTFKFIFMIILTAFLGMKLFEISTKVFFSATVIAEFVFVCLFVLTTLMFLYGFYGIVCDLFGLKKYELSQFFDSKEKPQYD